MICLDELLRYFEVKLYETSAMKIRKQETVKHLKDKSEELKARIEKLNDKQEQKKAIVDVKIKSKKYEIQKLKANMMQMHNKYDEEIAEMM